MESIASRASLCTLNLPARPGGVSHDNSGVLSKQTLLGGGQVGCVALVAPD
jgi:hypothetical protein